MDWSTNLQMITAGLAMGSIYALVALGFVLIFNAVNVVNFAQGEFVMVPAFVAVWLMNYLNLPFPLTCAVTVIFMGLFGIVFQRIAYYPLRHRSFLPVVISTIGVGIFLKNGAQLIFGAEPLSMATSKTRWSFAVEVGSMSSRRRRYSPGGRLAGPL